MKVHLISALFRPTTLREIHHEEFLSDGLRAGYDEDVWKLNSRVEALNTRRMR